VVKITNITLQSAKTGSGA